MTEIWRMISEKRLRKAGSVTCTITLVLSLVLIGGMILTQNASAGTVPPATISSDTTWTTAGSPYWIEYDVTVESDATLTIDPGVNVKFNGSYSLIIDGDLIAIGTPSSKINFTSNQTVPEPGDWQSIKFNKWQNLNQYTSTIKHATIEYATYGVHCNNRSVAIENSTVTANEIGIYSTLTSTPLISNNTISSNNKTGIDWSNDCLTCDIFIWQHLDNRIWNNTISNNGDKGINLSYYAYPIIEDNDIYSNGYGVHMEDSIPWLFDNNISANTYGVYSIDSAPKIGNETVPGNNIINNNAKDGVYITGSYPLDGYPNLENNTIDNNADHGVILVDAQDVRMRNNTIANSSYNFGVWADTLPEFDHDIDNTSLVNQKPIYYWRNHEHDDEVIPSDAGYVGVVNSTNISVKNLTLTKNGQGVLIAYSNCSAMNNISASDNEAGIILYSSPDNNVLKSNISNNDYNGYHWRASGIYLYASSHNTIMNNTASSNSWDGILLYQSNNNIIANNIANHTSRLVVWGGILLYGSNNNTIDNNTAFLNHYGIFTGYSSVNNTIISNTAYTNIWGVYLYDSSGDNYVINNTLYDNYYGLSIAESDSNFVTNNTNRDNWIGIYTTYYADNNVIANNNVSSNDYDGISMEYYSASNNVSNNTIKWNGHAGINVYENSSANITNNEIRNNTDYGIYMNKYSNATIDDNNTIAGNTQGIYLANNSNANITWNDIHNNSDAGINCTSGSNPAIHYNNIEDNLHDLNDPESGYGVNNQDDSLEVDAKENWWGDDSGPYHETENFDGEGNQVSDDVDFKPFSLQQY